MASPNSSVFFPLSETIPSLPEWGDPAKWTSASGVQSWEGSCRGVKVDSLSHRTVSLLLELLECDVGMIVGAVDSAGHLEMTLVPSRGFSLPDGVASCQRVEMDQTMAGLGWATQSTVVSADVASDQRFSDPLLSQLAVVSGVMVPVTIGQQPHQLLGLLRRNDREITAEEIALIESLAQLLASQIQRGTVAADEAASACPSVPVLSDPKTLLASTPTVKEMVSRMQAERRVSPRHEYRRQQWIGPIGCGVMPRREDYFPVECVDISTGGFAFYLDKPPTFNALVVILDMHQPPLYVAARIVHVRKRTQDSRVVYEVGCQFVVRL
jgi:hypothetical protein